MKITDVECLVLDGSFPFVLVHTDEGLTGIGECFRRQPGVTKSIVDSILKPVLLGKDPLDTEVRWSEMMRAGSALEMGGAIFCAIAGLDIALWDLAGKAYGEPIHRLLGGKVRDRVRMYASSMRRDMTPEEEARRASSVGVGHQDIAALQYARDRLNALNVGLRIGAHFKLKAVIAFRAIRGHVLGHFFWRPLRDRAVENEVFPVAPAKQRTDGQPATLPENIPASHVNRGFCVRVPFERRVHAAIQALELGRILAD